jgi:hypothetical protein
MSKDHVDTGVDLHIAQLLGEGKTWLLIHPHGHHPLMERLNPAAEKGLQKVNACQPFPP